MKVLLVGREVEINGPQRVVRNSLIERQIEALEDDTKPIPAGLLNAREQKEMAQMGGRVPYAEHLRSLLIEDSW